VAHFYGPPCIIITVIIISQCIIMCLYVMQRWRQRVTWRPAGARC